MYNWMFHLGYTTLYSLEEELKYSSYIPNIPN